MGQGAWKQGYATEMVKALIEFVKKNGEKQITADVAQLNEGSNAVMRKLGGTMPYKSYEQPEFVQINDIIRLKRFDGDFDTALSWYQKQYVYYNSEGVVDPDKIPQGEYIERMYRYLDRCSELYFIEALENGTYVKIGDVAIKPENPPIVIGEEKYLGKGYSKEIMCYVFERLRAMDVQKITRSIVYKHNQVSLNMHLSLGYVIVETTDEEYVLEKQL